MAPEIGVVVPPWFPPEAVLPAATAAEAAGLDQVWLWEDCFAESGLGPAAAVLARTERVRVGVGLLPTPLRNVALTAMEVATIDRMFPGRFQPVVGHGVQGWMAQAGARVESPLTLLREYVTALDRLLAGEEVTTEGRYVRLDRVRLTYPPLSGLLAWAAGNGEKSLALIGETATGALVDSGTSPNRLREIVGLLLSASGGRARPSVAVYAHVLRAEAVGRYEPLYGDLPTDPADARALAGTAAEIAQGIDLLARAGAAVVILRPDESETELEAFIRFVADDVVPLLRSRAVGTADSNTTDGR